MTLNDKKELRDSQLCVHSKVTSKNMVLLVLNLSVSTAR